MTERKLVITLIFAAALYWIVDHLLDRYLLPALDKRGL